MNMVVLRELLGKHFRIYGDFENPLFLAKDVAKWIEHKNPTEMIRNVDEDEKLVSTILSAGQNREVIMLTEDGFYEVLMQSRKPIAKQFKKKVKEILKEIRKTGQYGSARKSRKEKLSSVNNAVQTMTRLAEKAGMKPEFQFYMAKQLYEQNGVEFPSIQVVQPEALLDLTMMARRLGVLSKKGIPHAQVVGAIIGDLALEEEQKVLTSFEKNGHVGTTVQYRESVLSQVESWLSERGYPPMIALKGKSYQVMYEHQS